MPENFGTSAYTYYVYHEETDLRYYGYRYANKVPPDQDFWIKYFTSSKNIKRLIKKYGKDSFKVQIRKVFSCAKTASEWESRVLKRLKVFDREDWLNIRYGGYTEITEEIKAKIGEKNSQHTYIVVSPNGEKIKTRKLSKIAKTHNLDLGALGRVANGISYQHMGWKVYIKGQEHKRKEIETKFELSKQKIIFLVQQPDGNTSKREFTISENFPFESFVGCEPSHIGNGARFTRTSRKIYKLVHPLGVSFLINTDIKNIAKMLGLDSAAIIRVSRGIGHHHKGWTCCIVGEEGKREENLKNKRHNKFYVKNFKLTAPDGKVYITDNLKNFGKLHDLKYESMYVALSGKYKTIKKWKVERHEYSEIK